MIKRIYKTVTRTFTLNYKSFFSNYRNSNNIRSKINKILEKALRNLNGASIPKILVGTNIAFWLLYNIAGRQRASALEFNPIFANFINRGFISLGLNSFILHTLATSFEATYGSLALLKVLLLALMHSTIFCSIAKLKNGKFNYWGNDAMIQALFFTRILKEPSGAILFLPIPIPIRFLTAGIIIVIMDLLNSNVPAFAGLGTAILFVKVLI